MTNRFWIASIYVMTMTISCGRYSNSDAEIDSESSTDTDTDTDVDTDTGCVDPCVEEGDDRLDISDIKDIWPDNNSPDSEYNWTNTSGTSIVSSAMSYLGALSDEYQNFLQKADDAGVNHGYAG